MADDWDQYAPVEEPPGNQAPTNWDQYQPAQEPSGSSSDWDRYAKVDETNDPRNPYGQSTQPTTTSLGVAGREFLRSTLPNVAGAVAGLGAGILAAPSAPATAGIGPIAAGLGAGMIVGGATRKLQDTITDTLGLDSPESRARDVTEHPVAALGGGLASALTAFQPAAIGKSIGEAVAQRGGAAAILGGVNAAQQYVTTGEVHPGEVAANAALGAVLGKPHEFVETPALRGAMALGARPSSPVGGFVRTDIPDGPALAAALKPAGQNPAPGLNANEVPPKAPIEPAPTEPTQLAPGFPTWRPEAGPRPAGEASLNTPTVQGRQDLQQSNFGAQGERGFKPRFANQNMTLPTPVEEAAPPRLPNGVTSEEFARQPENVQRQLLEIANRRQNGPTEEVGEIPEFLQRIKIPEPKIENENFGEQGVVGQNENESAAVQPRALSAEVPQTPDWRSTAAGEKLGLVGRLRDAINSFAPIKAFRQAFDLAALNEATGQFAQDVREAQGTTNKQALNYTKLLEPFNKEAQRAPATVNTEWLQNYQRGTLPADHPYAPMQRAAHSVDFAYDQRLQQADPDGDMQRFWLPKLFGNFDQARDFVQKWFDSGRTNLPKLGDFMDAKIPFRPELLRKSDLSPDPIKVMQNLHNFYDTFLERNKIVDLSLKRGGGPIYEQPGPGLVQLPQLTRNSKPLYATPEVKMMWERYFGPDAMEPFSKDFLSSVQRLKNITTAFQLLGGGYHAVAETGEAINGDIMRTISQAMAGRFSESAKALAGAPLAPIRQAWISAAKGRQAYFDYENASPLMQQVVKELTKAGITPERITRYTPEFNITQNFFQSWGRAADDIRGQFGRGEYGGAAKDTFGLIGKGMQAVMHPLFNVYIPRLKFGAAVEQMAEYIAANPDKPQLYQKMAIRIGKSIDDRLGELNQSTLFWNRTLKNAANLLMISPGWEVGTLRAAIGGAKSLVTNPARMSITHPDFQPNAAFPFAFAITTAAIGSIYQFLKTGEMPQDMEDPFFPRTGGIKKGEPERAILPGYLKDIYSWWHGLTGQEGMAKNASSMLYNKLAAVPKVTWDTMANENFAGKQIYNPNDPLHEKMRQYLSYVADAMLPITVKQVGRTQGQQAKGSNISTPEAFTGIKQAPSTLSPSFGRQQQERNRKAAEDAKRFHQKTGYFAGGLVGDGRADPKSMPAQSPGTTSFDDGGPVPDKALLARQNTGSDASKQLAGDTSLTGMNSEIAPQITRGANWNKFESEARPSQNVVDERKRGFMRLIPSIGDVAVQTGGLSDAGYARGGPVKKSLTGKK